MPHARLPLLLLSLAAAAPVRAGCPIVAGGQYHSVALQGDGSVWAWGWNLDGQLGDGTTANRGLPVQVRDATGAGFLSGAVAVAAAGSHSMALTGDGSVWTWGDNSNGQLGIGSVGADSRLPVQVKDETGSGALGGIVAIAAGGDGTGHCLALGSDGSLWAWGSNFQGELGTGTLAISSLPVRVKEPGGTSFLSGVRAVSAGGRHNLALKDDGTLLAWGDNFHGQLGDGTASNYSWLPVPVKDAAGTGLLGGVAAVAAGAASGGSGTGHSLALRDDGTVWAWGSNRFGALGNGTTPDASLPVQVKDASGSGFLLGVTAIAGGADHSLALAQDGSLWAWGFNQWGQLGNGGGSNRRLPVRVRDANGTGFLASVVVVDSGHEHPLALQDDGSLWAWGLNLYGQLGNDTTANASLPVRASILLSPGAGQGVPPDQGNVLRAVKRVDDVVLTWTGTGAASWGVYRDRSKLALGRTLLPPLATAPSFVDGGIVPGSGIEHDQVRGRSACGVGP